MGVALEAAVEMAAGVAVGMGCDDGWWAFDDDLAAVVAAFRAQVDDPVAHLEQVQVVFHDDYGIAEVHQLLEDFDQFFQVMRMEAGGGFVQEEQACPPFGSGPLPPPAGFGAEIAEQFQALGFASGEGAEGLAQPEIIQADGHNRAQGSRQGLMVGNALQEFLGGAFEHIRNGQTPHPDVENFVLETAALALGATNVDVRQKLHLDALEPFAPAELTAASRLVERKVPGQIAPGDRFGGLGQKASQGIEGMRVGQEIGAGTPPERLLIHQDKVG